ncbi:Rossmann-fold NAD(P)-binding domain-containing protein [Filobacillus milosensis]|nr:short-chain dehydrogenase [Filobacillus milosensis]
MKRALVIGGSGMLANVSVWLSDHDYEVYVVGRTKWKMSQLLERPNKITPIYVDYQDEKLFRQKINQTFDWDLVVAWIHNVPGEPMCVLVNELSKQDEPFNLYHVLGSSTNLHAIREKLSTPKNCTYHQVQLGFKIEDNHSRWLTHKEISNGVIEAIQSGQNIHIIGQLEPWDQRP